MTVLTVSGNEVTDAVRLAGVSGDGRSAPDSSFGVWEATTNRYRFGKAKSITDSFAFGGAVRTQDPTVVGPFVDHQSIKVVTSAAANDGVGIQSALGRAAALGSPTVGSIYVKGAPGVVLYSRSRWTNTDASVTDSGQTFITLDGTWQELESSFVNVAAGKTGDVAQLMIRQRDAIGTTFWVSAGQIEDQPLATPYVPTDGATATRAAGRVQCPVGPLLDETTGAVLVYTRMGYSAAADPHNPNTACFWEWGDDLSNRFALSPQGTGGRLRVQRRTAAGIQDSISTGPVAWTNKDDMVAAFYAWTATTLRVGANGGACVTVAGTPFIPALAATQMDIGDGFANTSFQPIDSDIKFVATFDSGDISNAEWAALYAAVQAGDPTPAQLSAICANANCTMAWPANTIYANNPPVDITPAVETNTTFTVTAVKRRTLDQAVEVSTAPAVQAFRYRPYLEAQATVSTGLEAQTSATHLERA